MSDFWKTSISQVLPNQILVRGYPIEELATRRSFGDVVHLLLTGELPSGTQGQLIEMILIVCCEHSLASPSVDAVRFVASSGVPLQTAVAAGVSAIGDVHGGAIEPCAQLLKRAVAQSMSPNAIYAELKSQTARLPGFGHPVHTRDPRAAVLLETAESMNLASAHTRFAKGLEEASAKSIGKHLPMNVDGAIAALICDMNIDPALGKAFFIIGRAPGYVAHAYEQMTRERPFKAAAPDEITYTGPSQRPVPNPSRNQP
jgi:citrate synthase